MIGRTHDYERRCPSPLRTCSLKWRRGGDSQQRLHDVYFLAFFGLAAGAAGAVVAVDAGAASLGLKLENVSPAATIFSAMFFCCILTDSPA